MSHSPEPQCHSLEPQSHSPEPRRSRRQFMRSATAACGGAFLADAALGNTPASSEAGVGCLARSSGNSLPQPHRNFKYCLNTSTINREKLSVVEQIEITADAGYDGIELWMPDLRRFQQEGGQLESLKLRLDDRGLVVESAIGFGRWIVNDDAQRQQGLEQCRQEMAMLKQLGGSYIAAPPVGATRKGEALELDAAADRYRQLLEIGREEGVIPQLELWGFSEHLHSLAEVLYVAAAAEHDDAHVLLDVYHLYKGGSQFKNLSLVPGRRLHCLHFNDYPASPQREEIGDADRVFPGDGVAPLTRILGGLVQAGFEGVLSLELFNREYWEMDAAEVARLGLQKMKACVSAL